MRLLLGSPKESLNSGNLLYVVGTQSLEADKRALSGFMVDCGHHLHIDHVLFSESRPQLLS